MWSHSLQQELHPSSKSSNEVLYIPKWLLEPHLLSWRCSRICFCCRPSCQGEIRILCWDITWHTMAFDILCDLFIATFTKRHRKGTELCEMIWNSTSSTLSALIPNMSLVDEEHFIYWHGSYFTVFETKHPFLFHWEVEELNFRIPS